MTKQNKMKKTDSEQYRYYGNKEFPPKNASISPSLFLSAFV